MGSLRLLPASKANAGGDRERRHRRRRHVRVRPSGARWEREHEALAGRDGQPTQRVEAIGRQRLERDVFVAVPLEPLLQLLVQRSRLARQLIHLRAIREVAGDLPAQIDVDRGELYQRGMDCKGCGRVNDEDANFCTGCRAPLTVGEPRPDAGERAQGSLPAGRIAGLLLGLGVLAVGAFRLAHRPSVQIETFEVSAPTYRAPDAPLASTVRAEPAARPPTETERLLAGTWVARVGHDAPRRASIDATMVQIGALRSGQVDGIERCVWLELYENLRGFAHECAVTNGEPSMLEQTDPRTGRSMPLGAALHWSVDGRRLRLEYDEDMAVGAVTFRVTELELPFGTPPFDVTQTFPEHPDLPPQAHRFEVFSGSFLGDPPVD